MQALFCAKLPGAAHPSVLFLGVAHFISVLSIRMHKERILFLGDKIQIHLQSFPVL